MDLLLTIPVDYDDTNHRYSREGQIYTSATQVVEKFRQPFNTREVAEKYAAKNGGTPEHWIEQWKQKKEKSLVRGNMIHDANETSLQGRMIDMFEGRQMTVHGDAIEDRDPWFQRPDGIYTERKLWHHGYRCAGRADKVILLTDRESGIRYAHVDDYKTNEALDKVSYQFKSSGNYRVMKPPIGHIMDCNWWHYQLQLSLYMFMLEYQGFTPGKITITHYPHEGEKETHPVTYLKREVLLMLNFINR